MKPIPITLSCFFGIIAPAAAMVGGAPPAGDAGRAVVLIAGSHGTSCTGVSLASTLVLTAAHCVLPGADYKLVQFDAVHQPSLKDITAVVRHPQFDVNAVLRHHVTADVALLKLAAPSTIAAAPLASTSAPLVVGQRFIVAGYGVATPGDGRSGGVVRAATLVATGQPGRLQLRLFDPAGKGERAGLGACTGDSGAPVFQDRDGLLEVVGLVSWSTGPHNGAGCGGLTGVTPLINYRDWIVQTARRMGASLAD